MPKIPSDPQDNESVEDRIRRMSSAATETQGFMLAALENLTVNRDTTFDKFYKLGQLLFPFVIIWLVYFVNAEISPVKSDVKQNNTLIKEAKEERKGIIGRLNDYDVKEARRDVVMENLQRDIKEIKDMLRKQNKSN